MKILVYQTSLSFEYTVDACEIIKNKNKNVKFGFIFKNRKNTSNIDEKNFEYLKKKKNKIFLFQEESRKKNLDLNYLKKFEKIYAKRNIWKMISADRVYGRGYINDIIGYKSKFTGKNSNEILLNFVTIAKNLEKIFKIFKPDVICIPNGLSSLEVSILESFSTYFNVKILIPEPYRIKNFFFFY